MKRIAIIGNAFGGSTTSLIEAFLKQEYVVDFYHLILGRRNTSSFETFDLPIRVAWDSVKQVKSFDYDGLRRFIVYGKRGNFRMYQVSSLNLYEKGLKKILNPITWTFLNRLVSKVACNEYNFINIIGQCSTTTYLSYRLKLHGANVVHSMHEVCVNHSIGDRLNTETQFLIKNHIPINVFSEKSKNDLLRLSGINSIFYSVIPFSLFTGYLEYKDVSITELRGLTDFVLFYGFIVDYKGLDVLFRAANRLKQLGFNQKIVIAGGGNVPCMDKIKKDDSFVVINRWIENAEISTLIRACHVVVCPYYSSSQTGITQTVFNFDKPIIATKVPAFVTTITNRETGLLTDINNAEEIADAIKESYDDTDLYIHMCNGVKDIRLNCESSWSHIVDMYFDYYINKD